MNLRWIAVPLAWAAWASIVCFGQAPRFYAARITASTNTVSSGALVRMTIEAVDALGAVQNGVQGGVSLAARRDTGSLPVITEIAADGRDVEITNPGVEPVAVSGWSLEVAYVDPRTMTRNLARGSVPSPALLDPGSSIRWKIGANSPGAFPELAVPAPWMTTNHLPTWVRWRNAAEVEVDGVDVWGGGGVGAPWNGPTVDQPEDTAWSVQRVGTVNRHRREDWRAGPASLGGLNDGLQLPWAAAQEVVSVFPTNVILQSGRWEGEVRVPEAGGWCRWAVDDGTGRWSLSAPFRVLPLPALQLEIPAAALGASESAVGPIEGFVVRVPEAAAVERLVKLTLEPAGEFAAPAQVALAAGQMDVRFAVTNLDDALPDGRARVTLRAEMAGHRAASVRLSQDDNETGVLRMTTWGNFPENQGFVAELGRVILPQAVAHDVEVQLMSADPNVRVPAVAVVPAGQVSVGFAGMIDGDPFYNGVTPRVILRASTSGWPPAEVSVPWQDDEHLGYTWDGARELPEGKTTDLLLRLAYPRTQPQPFRVTASGSGIDFPAQVVVRAGETEVRIPVTVPADQNFDFGRQITFCAEADALPTWCHPVQVLDDDVPLAQIHLPSLGAAWLSRLPVGRVSLLGADGRLYRTNVTGEVRVETEQAGGTELLWGQPLAFVDGEASFSLGLTQAVMGASIQVRAAGLSSTRWPLDVLEGGRLPGPWLEVGEPDADGTLLLLRDDAEGTRLGQALVEFDTTRWQTNRVMVLPSPAHGFSVAPGGRVAWAFSAAGSVQRVERAAATGAVQEWAVAAGDGPSRVFAAAGLDEAGERVLVLAGRQPLGFPMEMELSVLVQGRPLSRTLRFTPRYSGNPTVPLVLLVGRTLDEWFLGAEQGVHRFRIDAQGIVPDSLETASAYLGGTPFLFRSGNELVGGNHARVGLDPLRTVDEFGGPRPAVVLDDGFSVGRGEGWARFEILDAASRAPRAEHSIPLDPGLDGWGMTWLRPWNTRGVLALWSDRSLLAWKIPWLGAGAADLALTVEAPARVERQSSVNGPEVTRFERRWTLTNRGPARAAAVTLTLPQNIRRSWDHLDPGASLTVVEEAIASNFGEETAFALVAAGTHDPVRTNNTARASTAILEPTWGSARQVRVSHLDLAVSPDGTRLWAVAAAGGPATPGGPVDFTGRAVVEIDPVSGTIVRTLPTRADPNAVEPTSEGGSVFVAEGMQGLTRWTLGAVPVSEHWDFPGESPRELVAIPGRPGAVVVFTERRALVWENGAELPDQIVGIADNVAALFAHDRLWLNQAFEGLKSYRVGATGLVLDGGPWVRAMPFQPLSFSAGPTHLFFNQEVFDLANLGFSFVPQEHAEWAEPRGGAVYGMTGDVFRRSSVPGFQLEMELKVPGFFFDPARFVRWGERGVALLRFDGWLLIDELPLVVQPGGAQLAVALNPESPVTSPGEQFWTVTVTNRSDVAASKVVVTLNGIEGLAADGWRESGGVYQQGAIVWYSGDLAARAAKTYRVRLTHPPGGYRLEASAFASGSADALDDNRVIRSGEVNWPAQDLQVSFPDPVRVVGSDELFTLPVRVRNASASTTTRARLQLLGSAPVQMTSVTPGTRVPTLFANEAQLDLDPIAAGAEVQVTVQLRLTSPALVWMEARLVGQNPDPAPANNGDLVLLVRELRTPGEHLEGLSIPQPQQVIWKWSQAGNRLLGGFSGFPGLIELDPASLAFRRWIRLSQPATSFAIAPSGHRVWVGQGAEGMVRLDLGIAETVTVTSFAIDPSVAAFAPWWFTVPGHEDVVVIHGRGADGLERTRAYRDGAVMPADFPLPDPRRDETLNVTKDGRLFLTSETRWQELRLTDRGVETVGEAREVSGAPGIVSFAGSQLVFGSGRVLDLVSGASDVSMDDGRYPYSITRVDGPGTQLIRAFMASDAVGRQRNRLEGFSLGTRQWTWRTDLERDAGGVRDLVSLGTNGTLLVDNRLTVLPANVPGPLSAPLTVGVTGPASVLGGVEPVPISVSVTNLGPWVAEGAWLEVEHGIDATLGVAGTVVLPGVTRFELGRLWGGTNLHFSFEFKRQGLVSVRFRVGSETPDPQPANHEVVWSARVPEDPMVYLDAEPIAEGSALVARLTAPILREVDVPFRITPGTASADDFQELQGSWRFYPGMTSAMGIGIPVDALGEGPETFRLEIVDSPVPVLRGEVDLVLQDGTVPLLTVPRQTRTEGDVGIAQVDLVVTLSTAMPRAVELGYEFVGGTAQAGSDFLPSSGRVRFEPGQREKRLWVALVADRDWEPNETILLRWRADGPVGVAEESVVMTVQNDDAPPRPVVELVRRAGNRLGVEFQSMAGVAYRLETAEALNGAAWRIQPGTLTGTGGRIAFEVTTAEATRFFRVSANSR